MWLHQRTSITRTAVLAAAFVFLTALADVAAAQQPPASSSAGTCKRCHDKAIPLPAQHPAVQGTNITECRACHKSQAGQAQPNPVMSRIHRTHTQAQVDCTSCHLFVPGKQFSVAGVQGNLGALDVDQYEMLRKAMGTWASSPWLAATHGKANLSCGACHQKQLIPDDNETVVNKQCMSCHGEYASLAKLTASKAKNPNINVHGSHLGPEIACTVCHQGHRESRVYCVNCHTNFEMPIPGGAAKPSAAAPAK
jgi:hypothetical protein